MLQAGTVGFELNDMIIIDNLCVYVYFGIIRLNSLTKPNVCLFVCYCVCVHVQALIKKSRYDSST